MGKMYLKHRSYPVQTGLVSLAILASLLLLGSSLPSAAATPHHHKPTEYEDKPSPSPSYEDKPSPSPSYEDKPSPSPSYEDKPSPSPSYEDKPSPSPSYEDKPSPSPSYKPSPSPSYDDKPGYGGDKCVVTPNPDANFGENPFDGTYCPKFNYKAAPVIKIPALLNEKYSVVVYKLEGGKRGLEVFRQSVITKLTKCGGYSYSKKCGPTTVDFKMPELACGYYEVEYVLDCKPYPTLPTKFKFEVGDKLISKKYSEKDYTWYYETTCGGKQTARGEVTTDLAKCKAGVKFYDAKDLCHKAIHFENKYTKITATWSTPVAPKGEVCPDTDVEIPAISVISISGGKASYGAKPTISLTYNVAGKDYASGAKPKTQHVGKECGPKTFTYVPTCSKQKFTIAINVGDSKPVFSKPNPSTYEVTYSTRCIPSGGPIKPNGAVSTDKGTCTASFTYPKVTNKCGKLPCTPESVKIPFTVKWTEPEQPKGPWCPGESVKLPSISVVPGSLKVKGSSYTSLKSSLTPSLSYTVKVLPAGLTLTPPALTFVLPQANKYDVCGKAEVVYYPQCAENKLKSLYFKATDEVKSVCGDSFTTRCIKKGAVAFGDVKRHGCKLTIPRAGRDACNAHINVPAKEVNICDNECIYKSPSYTTPKSPAYP